MVDPPQNATTIGKSDSGASNNYWRTEDMLVLINIKDTHNGLTVHFPNNATMNTTKTDNIPLSRSIRNHANKTHIFDSLHSASIISLGQLCDNDCIAILDKNKINIIKDKKFILKRHRKKKDGLWDIPISRPLRSHAYEIITGVKTKNS